MPNSELIIQFQLDTRALLSFVYSTMSLVFITSLFFAFIMVPMSMVSSRKFARKIDKQVARELALIIAEKESTLIHKSDVALPQIDKSLIELRSFK